MKNTTNGTNGASRIEAALAGGAIPEQATARSREAADGAPGFEAVLDELMAMLREGRAPEGFELASAAQDPAFAELLADYPADAAARIYLAEKRANEAEQNAMRQVSTRVQSRKGLPVSQRGAAMPAPENDYANMSGETFRELLASLKKTARNGGRTRL